MLDKDYWESRYQNENTGWDVGLITTPIKEYVDQLKDKSIKILIPGGGNSYEAQYLWQNGFSNVFVCDIAKKPLDNLLLRCPSFPPKHLLQFDFFDLDDSFDLIIEQTFFCALPTTLRNKYAQKINSLLNKNGKLVGLLFNSHFEKEGPPFGGTKKEYLDIFEQKFFINKMEDCYNSILPRMGSEYFIMFTKI